MKKMVVLLLVLILMVAVMQVAFANPDPPNSPPTDGSCNMLHSWWAHEEGPGNWVPDKGPGNHNGVEDGDRGMYHVHFKDNPNGYTNGAANMDAIGTAHCGG